MAKKTKNLKISEKLFNSVETYCKLNSIDIQEYVENSVSKTLMEDKYGSKPFEKEKDEKTSEKPIENQKNIAIFVDKVETVDKTVVKEEESVEKPIPRLEIKEEPSQPTRKRRKLN